MNADALLAIIAGQDTDSLIEIRCRRPSDGRITAREWFPVSERAECVRFMESHAAKLDVYVGVAPRIRREGGKSAIPHSWCLWVDCDTPEAMRRLQAFSPRPSMVISSGTGKHAYWSLRYPLLPAWTERANRRLAHALGADVKATDIARILRPPQTYNHKHDPPVLVVVDSFEDSSVSVACAVKNLADPPTFRPSRRQPRGDFPAADVLDGVSAERYYATLTGRPVGHGNVQCPFHGDGKERNPSMKLYDTTWYCFVCCKGGSVYEFGAMLWGFGTRGADFTRLRERLTDALN